MPLRLAQEAQDRRKLGIGPVGPKTANAPVRCEAEKNKREILRVSASAQPLRTGKCIRKRVYGKQSHVLLVKFFGVSIAVIGNDSNQL